MSREKTHTSINVSMTPAFRNLIAKKREQTGDSYAQQIAIGLKFLEKSNIDHAPEDPYGGDKKQKVFSVTFETNDKLDELMKLTGKTKTALVQAAFLAYSKEGKEKPVLDSAHPILETMSDRVLLDELRRRGYDIKL